MTLGSVRMTAVIIAAVALTSGCTKVVTGSALSAPGNTSPTTNADSVPPSAVDAAASCTHVDAPLQDIPAHGDSEPLLRVPQLPGWNRVTKMDSEVIRFTLVNSDLIANKFAPNLVVTLEGIPQMEPQAVFDQQEKNLRDIVGATDMSSASATVCGLPAEKLTLVLPAMGAATSSRPAQALAVVAHIGSHEFLVTATVQSTDADNPTYQQDSQTMLDGLQVLTPNA
jgi:hypothetical protein